MSVFNMKYSSWENQAKKVVYTFRNKTETIFMLLQSRNKFKNLIKIKTSATTCYLMINVIVLLRINITFSKVTFVLLTWPT